MKCSDTLNERGTLRNRNPPRWFLPLVVGVLTFVLIWVGQEPPGVLMDFDYLWAAGHAVWHGRDPHVYVQELIDRGLLYWPLYYPGTTAVLMAPFGALSRHLAYSLFTALGVALLTWSLKGYRRWMLLSPPVLQAVLFGQWSPWLTAAVGLPWLGFIWSAKPSIGLALFAGWPSRKALYSGLAVVILSFILLPSWPVTWYEALQDTPHYRAPVMRVGGFLLLLAFLKWRTPEARMLGILALVPQSAGLYEQLPLLLIPQTPKRFAALMALTYLAATLSYTLWFPEAMAPRLDAVWPYFLVLVYLPALYFVLQSRSPKTPGERPSQSLPHPNEPDSQPGTRG